MNNNIIIHSLEEYRSFISTLIDGPVFTSTPQSDKGLPRSYPCLLKITQTGAMSPGQEQPIDTYLVNFFYVEDARALLGIGNRATPEGYDYAEAEPERGQ